MNPKSLKLSRQIYSKGTNPRGALKIHAAYLGFVIPPDVVDLNNLVLDTQGHDMPYYIIIWRDSRYMID